MGNEATKRKVAFPKIAIITSVSLPEGSRREAGGSQCISGEAPGGVQQDRFEKRKVEKVKALLYSKCLKMSLPSTVSVGQKGVLSIVFFYPFEVFCFKKKNLLSACGREVFLVNKTTHIVRLGSKSIFKNREVVLEVRRQEKG